MAFSTYTARGQKPITTSDTEPQTYAAIYVGGAGTVTITDVNGDDVTWTMPAGTYINAQCIKVKSTGTTATLLIGLNDQACYLLILNNWYLLTVRD